MTGGKLNRSLVFCVKIAVFAFLLGFSVFGQDKNPVVFIPGLAGSELRHKDTNERIWFRAFKSKSEDLRLPLSSDIARIHDDLIPGDVLREVKIGVFPLTDVYGSFIRAMETRGGYHEEKWDTPSEEGYKDSLYVFPYDWRLDNVQNARLLVRKIEALKLTLKRPDLKFDLVAHSMGGIISRYAVMYGDADLPTGDAKPVPTWAGAKLFDKVILLGTPNEGAALALSNIVEGFTISGLRIDLPFVQDMSKFTVFTIPSGYQLLPAPGTLRAFDDKLQPISIDLFDPKVWTKYGWNVIDDKEFAKLFNAEERKVADDYFFAALDRARRLHEALAAAKGKSGGVEFDILGSDCKTASDAIIVYHDDKADKWKTIFRPKSFTRPDGRKVSEDELKKLMNAPGDGIVAERSLRAETQSEKAGMTSILGSQSDVFVCEEHHKLGANAKVQDYVIGILDGKGKVN